MQASIKEEIDYVKELKETILEIQNSHRNSSR